MLGLVTRSVDRSDELKEAYTIITVILGFSIQSNTSALLVGSMLVFLNPYVKLSPCPEKDKISSGVAGLQSPASVGLLGLSPFDLPKT